MRNFLYLLGALATATLMAALLPALAQTASPATTAAEHMTPDTQHRLDQKEKDLRAWSGPRKGG